MIQEIVFGYLASVIVITSVLAVTGRNAVHNILWMLVMFFHLAVMYITLNAEFIAAIQLIVYAGAILVLFLFVVFLLNLREEIQRRQFMSSPWVAGLLAISIFGMLVMTFLDIDIHPVGEWTPEAIHRVTPTVALGQEMYTNFLMPFEIVSLILLIAVVGAVLIAKTKIVDKE
jgi:NADH-quinone oxidoreductase subunit J